MIRLRVALGKNVHRSIGWINPETARDLGLAEGDILIDSSFMVNPFKIQFSDLVKPGEIALPSNIMFKLGMYVGEEREFKKVEEIKEAKEAVLYVVGDIHDWVRFRGEVEELFVSLDDEFSISPETSVRVLDIDGAFAGEVYRITENTKIKLMFAGLMNLAIAIDSSRNMIDSWGDWRKIDVTREVSKILLEYNLRKAWNAAIFSYADYVDILLNWISIDPKYRWFMTRLITRFVTDMIISDAETPDLVGALEYVVDSFAKKNLGHRFLNTILVFQAVDTPVKINKVKEILEQFKEISNGVWRTVWVGIGKEDFTNFREVAKTFGGICICAKTIGGLIKRARNYSDFRYIDGYQ